MKGPVTDLRSSLGFWELVLQPWAPKESSGICIKQIKFVPGSLFLFLFCLNFYFKFILGGFPGGTVVKNPPANAGDTGSSPSPGRSHMLWSN